MDLSSQWEVGGEVWVKLELSQAGVGVRVQSGDGWCWFPSRVSIRGAGLTLGSVELAAFL